MDNLTYGFFAIGLDKDVELVRHGALGYRILVDHSKREVGVDDGRVRQLVNPKGMPQVPSELLRQMIIMLGWVT